MARLECARKSAVLKQADGHAPRRSTAGEAIAAVIGAALFSEWLLISPASASSLHQRV
jgi:hypothetical protein